MANLAADGEKTAWILNKQISFETFSRISENIAQPLVLLNKVALHLLHNAIDHGLETAVKRVANNKHPVAKIAIIVKTADNRWLLQITDDGRGIEIEKVARRAWSHKIIPADQSLRSPEAVALIFSQGFTTGKTISEISGGSVGLDAVRDLVERAGGKIESKRV